MWIRIKRRVNLILIIGLVSSYFAAMNPASASISNIGLDFAAAEPTSYNHASGGGMWNQGRVNIDIERSLEGEEFACNDVVSYLTKLDVPNLPDLAALGEMNVRLVYRFDMDTTGRSGSALGAPTFALLNSSDPASSYSGSSSVTLISSNTSGVMFSKGAEMINTVEITGVQAGEKFVIRTDVTISCQAGARPTGNLQARLSSGSLVATNGGTALNPTIALNSGEMTVTLKNVQDIGRPILQISKTVSRENESCPGVEYLIVEPDEKVRYCYKVTNPSNVGRPGAPLYNVSQIFDDHGHYPDYEVVLSSGLTDIDGDGQVDDLAAGGTAYGEQVLAFDGNKDDLVINTATVYADDALVNPVRLNASDTAAVFIDAPPITPSLTIEKLTNGSDSATILIGSLVTWSYKVTNTGNVNLVNINVMDNRGVTVSCPDTSLAVSAYMTCSATGFAIAGNYTNIGTAYGSYETTTVSASDNSGYFGADPKISIVKSPETQVVVEGEKASFTITVTNTGNVPLTEVVVTDSLVNDCAKTVGNLAAGEFTSYSCQSASLTSPMTNLANVVGKYGDISVSDTDLAGVTIDYLPKISVTKSASPTSVLETGGDVTFTVVVNNLAVENFTLVSLVDDKFGNLNGIGNCQVPQVISASGSYTCNFIKSLSSDLMIPHTDTVTATGQDPEAHQTSATDDAMVTFTNVMPDISLTKTVNPNAVRSTGGYVDYNLRITNNSLETVTVYSFSDSSVALSTGCLSLIGKEIPPKGYLECTIPNYFLSGSAGTSFTNEATAIGRDNEGNFDSATATAIVKFWWFGRTPGFWKTHPESWISGDTPNVFIQNRFIIPSGFMTGSILDLDKNGNKDRLIDGLGYKGGSTLQGAAQILLRAAIAALLNEEYYGNDYPGATSPAQLVSQVNSVLATQSRSEYLLWASYYDYWNNGVEGPLP